MRLPRNGCTDLIAPSASTWPSCLSTTLRTRTSPAVEAIDAISRAEEQKGAESLQGMGAGSSAVQAGRITVASEDGGAAVGFFFCFFVRGAKPADGAALPINCNHSLLGCGPLVEEAIRRSSG